MRKTYAAKLRNVLSASIASGRLADDLNELTRAELEFIAHDWEIWARDDQLAPLLIAPGDSPAGSRPPGALSGLRARAEQCGAETDEDAACHAIEGALQRRLCQVGGERLTS
jgi:hypothetical protein